MQFLSTLLGLTLVLAPVAHAAVACCSGPFTGGSPNNCKIGRRNQASCCLPREFNNCGNQKIFKTTVDSGKYGDPPALGGFDCPNGGTLRCTAA
ncbi:uncharacterized protein RSE6_06155 [Rhynchosporium secalis]|uniref:Uncharacterized protein n=1 Tax=Rhynchosporium secalis TaxID=38038 RepID=A0A1E1M9M3_RHYSE|nr:uncharacterized protein RSE6_06155 [Rhynchosporium secalis]